MDNQEQGFQEAVMVNQDHHHMGNLGQWGNQEHMERQGQAVSRVEQATNQQVDKHSSQRHQEQGHRDLAQVQDQVTPSKQRKFDLE